MLTILTKDAFSLHFLGMIWFIRIFFLDPNIYLSTSIMVDIRQEFIHLAGALMEHFLEGIVLFLAIGTLEHTT